MNILQGSNLNYYLFTNEIVTILIVKMAESNSKIIYKVCYDFQTCNLTFSSGSSHDYSYCNELYLMEIDY